MPEKISKPLIITGVIAFLALALILNFVLQKDYFIEIGFSGWIIVVSILLLDGSKILSEILFFKTKLSLTKFLIGSFTLILICLSAYTTFGVRQWKSISSSQITKNQNDSIHDNNKQVNEHKHRLEKQLEGFESDIKIKEKSIALLKNNKTKNNIWVIYNYNKAISKLNEDKKIVLQKIEQVEAKLISSNLEKVSLLDALTRTFGTSSQNIETATNLVVALTVEGIILFLCFALSYTLRQKAFAGDLLMEQNTLTADYKRDNGSAGERLALDEEELDGDALKHFRKMNNLTQSQLSELIKIPRGTIAKLETGRGELTDDLKKRLSEFENLIVDIDPEHHKN